MIASTVVKKVTANPLSGRAEIDLERITRRSTVVKQDSARSDVLRNDGRGFQHIYKSTRTASSRRVQAAYNLSLQNRLPRSTKAARRDKAKRKKLEALTTVSPSAEHSLCKSFFLDGRPIFFSGTPVTNTTILPHQFRNGHTLCATQHLKVVDTTVGARLKLDNGDRVHESHRRKRRWNSCTK